MEVLLNTSLHDATINQNYSILFLNVLDSLLKTHKTHWDPAVRDNAYETLKLIRELDPEGFQEVFIEINEKNKENQGQEKMKVGWANISELALLNKPKISH